MPRSRGAEADLSSGLPTVIECASAKWTTLATNSLIFWEFTFADGNYSVHGNCL